jgi:hypothetical protein
MNLLGMKRKLLPFSGPMGGGGKGGGGGGGGPQQVTSTTTSSNIPEYARPYVENMLQSAQAQIYNDDMTSFRPYEAYSSDPSKYFAGFSPMQQQAQQSAYNLQTPGQFGLGSELAGQAGIQSLGAQQRADFLGNQALGYGQAGQMYGDVGQMYGAQGAQQAQLAAQNAQRQAQMFGQGAVRTGQQALGYGAQGAGYGQGAVDLGQQATQLAQQQGLGYGAQGAGYGEAATGVGRSAAELAAQQGLGYGAAGAGYGSAAAGLAPVAQRYGQEAADIGMGGLGFGAMGAGFGGRGAQAAEQGFGAGEQFARQATDPRATQAYMSPYMQNVVDYQKTQAARDYQIAQQARQAGAVAKGAFGGSRQAIENAEAQRNLMSQLQGIEGMGAQKAFEDAQRQQQFGANLGLQGLQAGYGGLGLGMQGAGVGLSGLGTALQGQQGRMQGLGQAGQFLGQGMQGAQTGLQGLQGALAGSSQALQGYQTGMQGAQTGLQGLQGALAGSAQGMQGYGQGIQGAQAGMQGVQGALAGYNTGLSGVGQQLGAGQLGLQGTAQGIQGAQAGMQGAQSGLQGVQGATQAGQYGLAGLGQGIQAGSALGNLGGQQLGAQQNIINTQSTLGGQQQAMEQQKINQAIQDFATQQQYPFMQLGMLNNLLRGLPMQSMSTQQYQAAPSMLTQGLGAAGTLAGAYKAFGAKEGGVIKGLKAGGAVAKYSTGDVVNSVRAKLEAIADQPNGAAELAKIVQTSSSQEVREMAQAVLMEKRIEDQAAQQAPQVPMSEGIAALPAPAMDQMAGGGIIAFSEGDQVEDPDLKYQDMIKRQREAAGITEPANTKFKEFMASQVGALPAMKDQAKGQMLMDYFSNFGTQPGGGLLAGLKAAKEVGPQLKATTDKVRKAEMDLMKGQADLEQADRLEKLGLVDKANDLRNKYEDREAAYKRTMDAAKIQAQATMANAARATDLDRDAEAYFNLLVGEGMDPKDPKTKALARQKAREGANPYAQSKLDLQAEAVITAREKEDGELKALRTNLAMADDKDKPGILAAMEARRQQIRADITKAAPAPGTGAPAPAVQKAPDISTVTGAPKGSKIGSFVQGKGFEVKDKDGNLVGYAQGK